MAPCRFPYPIVALLLLAGCARPSVLQVDGVVPRAERSPEEVRLLLDEPAEPYLTIAVIRSTEQRVGRDMEALKAQVRAEAARLGADAVILGLAESGSGGGSGLTPDGKVVFVTGSSDLRVIGRAIVFTGQR